MLYERYGEWGEGLMEDNAVLQNLLTDLDNIKCHKCGKTAMEFVEGRECLLGCLHFTIDDVGGFLFWTCPECMKGVNG